MGIKNRFDSVFYFEGRLKVFRRPLVYLVTFDFYINKIYH